MSIVVLLSELFIAQPFGLGQKLFYGACVAGAQPFQSFAYAV